VPLPLEGIRIIDLSWIIAGPLATRFLAHFGADVIKVESRSRMDVGRANRTPLYGDLPGDANSNPDTGGYFQDVNAGKRSCTLDLTTEGGRELLRRLVRVSDAIICNLAGDQLVRWGVGYEQACELNPGIIVVNVPAMESSGPRTGWRGFGDTFAAWAASKPSPAIPPTRRCRSDTSTRTSRPTPSTPPRRWWRRFTIATAPARASSSR
jgi:crotonobetainyl-CoA:carnitine CoA-transferase CaiB-like acyl-CoA transferase